MASYSFFVTVHKEVCCVKNLVSIFFVYRFWYDLGKDHKTRFTRKELRSIRRVTMSRIICDNTPGLEEIQPFAFKANDLSYNKPVSCKNTDKIKTLDITPFNGVGAKRTRAWIE